MFEFKTHSPLSACPRKTLTVQSDIPELHSALSDRWKLSCVPLGSRSSLSADLVEAGSLVNGIGSDHDQISQPMPISPPYLHASDDAINAMCTGRYRNSLH